MLRPKLTRQEALKILEKKGLSVNRVIVLSVRGYYLDSQGDKGKNDRGIYDDAAFIITPAKFHAFNFNTDPSIYKKKIATLVPGVHVFIAGMHKLGKPGTYQAFRQYGDFKVFRDGEGIDVGYFGINLHKGGTSSTSSLGCQTVPANQWEEFRALMYSYLGTNMNAVAAHPSGVPGTTFRYVLITKEEMDSLLK